MNKILIVAQSEFATLVRSKAFLISLILMPLIMVASVVLVRMSEDATDTTTRRFAYVDRSGFAARVIEAAARARNAAAAADGVARFEPVAVQPGKVADDALRVELSDRVRREEIFAFVEIPANIADPDAKAEIQYYSNHPSYAELPTWLRLTVNQAVLSARFQAAALDPATVARLTQPAALAKLGLFSRDQTGGVRAAGKVDNVRAIGVPAVMMVLMFIVILAGAPQLLNSVIEEKMSRISEVLIGSITSFELLMGKLLGGVGFSLLLAAIYLSGGVAVATTYGYADAVTPAMAGWFVLFLVMAALIFGSMFIAVGAACNDLKDSQNMMTPVMLFMMVPVFTWGAILRVPDGALSLGLSLFPTTAPFLMLLRIGIQPGPPLWQVLLAVALMALTTVTAVWAAGRIFRTGILMQGKSASVREMMRWIRVG